MEFFLNKNKQSSFLKSRYFVIIISVVFILVLLIGSFLPASDSDNITKQDVLALIIFLFSFGIALFIFLHKHKAYKNFIVDDLGIKVNNVLYSWKKIKRYHWLGESQGERTGSSGIGIIGYDPINPNKYADTQVARVRTNNFFIHRHINLELDKEKVNDLINLFKQYGIKHKSRWRNFIGI